MFKDGHLGRRASIRRSSRRWQSRRRPSKRWLDGIQEAIQKTAVREDDCLLNSRLEDNGLDVCTVVRRPFKRRLCSKTAVSEDGRLEDGSLKDALPEDGRLEDGRLEDGHVEDGRVRNQPFLKTDVFEDGRL